MSKRAMCSRCLSRLVWEVTCWSCPMCGERVHDKSAGARDCYRQYWLDAQSSAGVSIEQHVEHSGARKATTDSQQIKARSSALVSRGGNSLMERWVMPRGWVEWHFGKARDDARDRAELGLLSVIEGLKRR